MLGTMMDRPLMIGSLLNRVERMFGNQLNASCEAGRVRRESTYRELGIDARKLGATLRELGVAREVFPATPSVKHVVVLGDARADVVSVRT